jgi:hypothetical protein
LSAFSRAIDGTVSTLPCIPQPESNAVVTQMLSVQPKPQILIILAPSATTSPHLASFDAAFAYSNKRLRRGGAGLDLQVLWQPFFTGHGTVADSTTKTALIYRRFYGAGGGNRKRLPSCVPRLAKTCQDV